jgi:hypothetical protein
MRDRTTSTLSVLLSAVCVFVPLARLQGHTQVVTPALIATMATIAAEGIEVPGRGPSCAESLAVLRIDGALRHVVHDIWHRSLTVRRQLARISGETALSVSFGSCFNSCQSGVTALTHIERQSGQIRRAEVEVSLVHGTAAAEIVAHELEHILEQLDGVDLTALAGSRGASSHGVRGRAGHAYETERARRVGRAAAAEYDAHPRSHSTCGVHP